MKENLNLFIRKLIHKAFPEFSNKVTWVLITVGLGILALPAPMYILFINFILDIYNKKTGSNISLIDVDNITPNNGVALTLVFAGLIYHLIIKGMQICHEIFRENASKAVLDRGGEADVNLYNRFIKILPPTSSSIYTLKVQDFGSSFHKDSIDDLDKFTDEWGYADQHFHDKELEIRAIDLYESIKNFNYFLSMKSGFIHAGPLLSIPTERDRMSDFEWSPQTEINVKKANELSRDIYKKYCDFISECRNKLVI
ncbi:hypothetical protein ACLEEK_16105 [Lonsdalea quercina]|uniref:hypothetical protein n=1 Tax=Lonsdalea quercina TaxID=71657 RepID=UPI0039756CD8